MLMLKRMLKLKNIQSFLVSEFYWWLGHWWLGHTTSKPNVTAGVHLGLELILKVHGR